MDDRKNLPDHETLIRRVRATPQNQFAEFTEEKLLYLDTNVLLSALLWGGTPHALMEHVRNGSVTLISSPALLAELARVIDRPKFDVILLRTNTSRAQTLAEVRLLAEVIDPPPLAQPVCRDKDDDAVLALAIAAQADIVISGDDDLLSLSSFEGIAILTPAQALQKVLDSL